MPTCHDRQQELSFISLNVHGSLTEKLKSEDVVTSFFLSLMLSYFVRPGLID